MAYIGNKNFNGVLETLINQIPCSHRYFSLFTGGGGLEFCNSLNHLQWICAEKDSRLHSSISLHSSIVFSDYKYLIAGFTFTSDDFIFIDPPYMFSTRRAGKKYYKHEFTVSDHKHLLKFISTTTAKVCVTHPPCSLYFQNLVHFTFIPLSYQSRQGIFNDGIWINYDISQLLLATPAVIGGNAMERQMIKRKLSSLERKISALSLHEKQLFHHLYGIQI